MRDKTHNLPTIIQLNNFLKSIRNKKDIDGALGNRVTLNDFLNLHTENKNIPEDPDQMFVADCFCDVTNTNGIVERVFRIFFTTKRLIEFVKCVIALINVIFIS